MSRVHIIESIVQRFPDRRFLLFGDAGEHDPEIYGEVARRYPTSILLICIRLPSPDLDDKERFQRAFRDLPNSRWAVSSEVNELGDVEALAEYQEQSPHP